MCRNCNPESIRSDNQDLPTVSLLQGADMCNKCDPSPNPGPGAAAVVCSGEVCVEEGDGLLALTEAADSDVATAELQGDGKANRVRVSS